MSNLVPGSDEDAKALQEVAKATGTALETLQKAGGYLAWIVGSTPKDMWDAYIGDPFRVRKFLSQLELAERVRKEMDARQIDQPIIPPLSFTRPLLDAVGEEDRPEIQELWAQLFANAMDPSKRGVVRKEFIDTLRQFEPLDALVLKATHENGGQGSKRDDLAGILTVSPNKISVTYRKLHGLACLLPVGVAEPQVAASVNITPYGQELMLAVSR